MSMRALGIALCGVLVASAAGLPPVNAQTQVQERPVVAVFDMEDRGSMLDPKVLDNLTEYLAAQLTEGGFQVLPRDQLKSRLLEQKSESYKECYDQSCQIELGREMAAQKSLATKILRIGDTCQLTAILFDLKKSTTDQAATAEASCHEKSLLVAVQTVAEKLNATLPKAEPKKTEFDQFLDTAKAKETEKNRASQSWQIIGKIARDPNEPKASRVAALKTFIKEFKGKNPHEKEAFQLLRRIDPSKVTVKTVPEGATILVDGQTVAKSPATMPLMAGKYKISAKLQDYIDREEVIEIGTGEDRIVTMSMEKNLPGKVILSTIPAGGVTSFDGKKEGKTPLEKEMMPGKHEITVTKKGYFKAKREVEISPSKSVEVTIPLFKVPPALDTAGHVFFWGGLGIAAFGGVAVKLASDSADDYYAGDRSAKSKGRTWTGVMWGSFGVSFACLVTGVILWALDEDEDELRRKSMQGTASAQGNEPGLATLWSW